MSNPEQQGRVPAFELRHRLALALESEGIGVSEMGTYLEVSASTMTNYLSGRTRPGGGKLKLWAIRCGVSYAWLIGQLEGPNDPSGMPVRPSGCNGRPPLTILTSRAA